MEALDKTATWLVAVLVGVAAGDRLAHLAQGVRGEPKG